MPRTAELPHALDDPDLLTRLTGGPVALFLDYDGTLTPIVARPELAVPPPGTVEVLERLARRCVVGIISGRDLADLRSMIEPAGVWLAGSHGFDVAGPDGSRHEVEAGRALLPVLAEAAAELADAVEPIPGAWVERKRYAIATHFRQVADRDVPAVEAAVDRVLARHEGLRKTGGKRIFELRPDVAWDKGRALWFLFDRTGARRGETTPVYLGDDVTDEDAFAALEGAGVGIVVDDGDRPTAATHRLRDPGEVRDLLDRLATTLEGGPA
jgi:trehalose-phosphatase